MVGVAAVTIIAVLLWRFWPASLTDVLGHLILAGDRCWRPVAMLWLFHRALAEVLQIPDRLVAMPDVARDHGTELAGLVRTPRSRRGGLRLTSLPADLWRAGRLLLAAHDDLPGYGAVLTLVSVPFLLAVAGGRGAGPAGDRPGALPCVVGRASSRPPDLIRRPGGEGSDARRGRAGACGRWRALTRRTVPDFERMTSDWVVTTWGSKCTPFSSSPSVMPVAAKKQLSPATRSSVLSTFVEVVAGGHGRVALLVVAGPQPALQLAAHALEGGRGDDALGRAADAEEDVGAGVGPGGRDGAGDVAVGDQADAGAGLADLGDEVVVAVALEDDGGDVGDAARSWRRPRPAGSRWAVISMLHTPTRAGPTAIFSM